MSAVRAHPYAPRVRTRYLHQLVRLRPRLVAWRRALFSLLTPAGGARALAENEQARGALLRRAYEASPFWQARFRMLGWGRHQLDEPGRWADLPPLTRADLQAHLEALTYHPLGGDALADAHEGVTSGSTGLPVRFRMDAAAHHSFFPLVDLIIRWLDLAMPRPWEGHALLDVLGHSPEYTARLPLFHGCRFEKITVGRRGWRERLHRLNPAVVAGDPDSIEALGETDTRPRLVLTSAFALKPDRREALVRALGCPVVEYYSAAEVGPMALHCPAGGGWHVLTPFVHLEAGPEGALRVTDLRNSLVPMLRYEVGDRGAVDASVAPCPCGLHTPRLLRLEGRRAVRFRRVDGGAWDPALLVPSLGRLPLREYDLTELDPGAVRLRYQAPQPLPPRAVEALGARLRAVAGPEARLDLEHAREPWRAPGVKPQPFVARS